MKTFIDPNLLQRLRVGPLAPYLDAYLKHIEQQGFLPSSATMQMYAICRFSKWLRHRQFDLHQVDEAAVNQFLKRDPGILHSCESATLRRLLAMLQQIGVTVAKASEPRTCHQRFIDDHRRYLLQERGLAEATLVYFVRFAEHVFGRLLYEKRLHEDELRGLREDKLKPIRSFAKFLAEDAA